MSEQLDSSIVGYIAQFLIFILGLCTLASWNVFITSAEYFAKQVNDTERYGDSFVSSVTIVQNIVMFISNLLIVMIFQKYSVSKKIFSSIVVVSLGFVALIGVCYADIQSNRLSYFILILLIAFILGAASTFMQCSAFSLLTNFPFQYTNSFLIGQGSSGSFVNVLLIICLATDTSERTTNTMFFVLTILVCIFAYVSFYFFMKSPVYTKYVLSKSPSNYHLLKATNRESEISQNAEPLADMYPDVTVKSVVVADTIEIVKCIWVELLSIYLGFAILLAYFPVLGFKMKSHVENQSGVWATKYYFVVIILLSFNLGDLVGRLFTKFIILPDPHSIWMLIASILRALFIVPFMMVPWKNTISPINNLLNHDFFPFLFFFLFAFTNGYLTTACLMKASSHVPDRLKEKSGTLCILVLGLGLFTGSLLSFATSRL